MTAHQAAITKKPVQVISNEMSVPQKHFTGDCVSGVLTNIYQSPRHGIFIAYLATLIENKIAHVHLARKME